MASTPRMNRALRVLRGYYRKLAEDIAQDIIDHDSDFGIDNSSRHRLSSPQNRMIHEICTRRNE
jgi:hypothetical protein